MKFLKDTRGDSTLLFLLFLIVISVMFLHSTTIISRNVALRSQLTRISEEIAMNVATAGMSITAASVGRTEIDVAVANNIAREVLLREGATGVTSNISLNNNIVLVEVVFNNIRARSTIQVVAFN